MNICLLSREYPPETAWGGIGTYTHSVAHGLVKSGHAVHVVSCTPGPTREYRDGDVRVYRLHSSGFARVEHLFPVSMISHSINASRKIDEIHAKHGLDIVEAPDWYAEAFWFSLRHTIPLVMKFHAPRFLIMRYNSQPRNQRIRLICGLEKHACLRADSLITPSNSLARIIAEEYRMNPEMIRVIPNFIHIPQQDGPAKRGLGRFVLYVGRLERIKGAFVLGDAVARVHKSLPDVRFIFCGSDTKNTPDRTSVREHIIRKNHNNPNIIFLGQCSRDELFSYYRSAAVCCIPSLWETLPYSGLEAMSFSRPIVGSRVGGLLDIIDDGKTGLFFTAGSSHELADALIRVLQNPKEAAEMGRRGKAKLDRQFCFDTVIKQQVAHYSEVIERFYGPIRPT